MSRTILFVVACGLANSAVAGEWIHRTPGWDNDAWAECRNKLDVPGIGFVSQAPGELPDGTQWSRTNQYSLPMISVVSNMGTYQAGWKMSIEDIAGCSRNQGTWTWEIRTEGDVTNMSPWVTPAFLDADGTHDEFRNFTVDAADAATMFKYWETPIADITGDMWTDAADAGRLFELWTGDSAPSSVPEPSLSLPAILLALLAKRRVVGARR